MLKVALVSLEPTDENVGKMGGMMRRKMGGMRGKMGVVRSYLARLTDGKDGRNDER